MADKVVDITSRIAAKQDDGVEKTFVFMAMLTEDYFMEFPIVATCEDEARRILECMSMAELVAVDIRG